jgi:hypothetical protein
MTREEGLPVGLTITWENRVRFRRENKMSGRRRIPLKLPLPE